jgi:integrase
LDAALNLKWSNFEETDTEVIVRYVDKGKKDFRPKISKKFFHELLRIKCNNENVFCISKNGVNRMMDRLRTKLDIQESRNIVFHSFRKAGAWYIYQKTGDIKLVQALLGHSNVATTDIYLQDAKEGIVADIPMSKDFDLETYRKVSHEELLDTIDKLPKNMKYLLAIALHKD